jgi:hypothetical protein
VGGGGGSGGGRQSAYAQKSADARGAAPVPYRHPSTSPSRTVVAHAHPRE